MYATQRSPREAPASGIVPSRGAFARRVRLLYVENHAVFASIAVEQFLSRHEVTIAPSLAAARAEWARSTFDAMLVDFDLDDGKGDAFVRELRGGFRGPIV